MSKFWSFASLLVIITLLFVTAIGFENQINFSDLETECRYHDAPDPKINFKQDNSLAFEGSFDVDNVKADLGYDYTVKDNKVVLDIQATNTEAPEDFSDTCLGQVVYIADTDPLSEGRYLIKLQHNGETVEQFIVRAK